MALQIGNQLLKCNQHYYHFTFGLEWLIISIPGAYKRGEDEGADVSAISQDNTRFCLLDEDGFLLSNRGFQSANTHYTLPFWCIPLPPDFILTTKTFSVSNKPGPYVAGLGLARRQIKNGTWIEKGSCLLEAAHQSGEYLTYIWRWMQYHGNDMEKLTALRLHTFQIKKVCSKSALELWTMMKYRYPLANRKWLCAPPSARLIVPFRAQVKYDQQGHRIEIQIQIHNSVKCLPPYLKIRVTELSGTVTDHTVRLDVPRLRWYLPCAEQRYDGKGGRKPSSVEQTKKMFHQLTQDTAATTKAIDTGMSMKFWGDMRVRHVQIDPEHEGLFCAQQITAPYKYWLELIEQYRVYPSSIGIGHAIIACRELARYIDPDQHTKVPVISTSIQTFLMKLLEDETLHALFRIEIMRLFVAEKTYLIEPVWVKLFRSKMEVCSLEVLQEFLRNIIFSLTDCSLKRTILVEVTTAISFFARFRPMKSMVLNHLKRMKFLTLDEGNDDPFEDQTRGYFIEYLSLQASKG